MWYTGYSIELTTTLRDSFYYHPRCGEEETEAQGDEATRPSSHNE